MISQPQQQRRRRYLLTMPVLIVVLLSLWSLIIPEVAPTSQQRVEESWRLANDTGSYHYTSTVMQTNHPTENVRNAGRSSTHSQISVEGAIDRSTESMNLKLQGYPQEQDALEIKVEEGKSQGRVGTGEWQPLDTPDGLFAPGGDPLGFLAAATNVEAHTTGDGTFYTFELNSVRFAEYMRTQLETAMRQQGQLPPQINLGLIDQYVHMQATGSLWLNDQGLPIREQLHLVFPAEREALNWNEADVTTTFSRWRATPSVSVAQVWEDPSRLATLFGMTPRELRELTIALALIMLTLAGIGFVLRRWGSRRIYAAVVTTVILSMLVTPLFQADQALAYAAQQEQKADKQAAQTTQQSVQTPKSDFNPAVSPYEQHVADSRARTSVVAATTSTTVTTQNCSTNTDSDSDGLNNDVECYELGTSPSQKDSDNDSISDKVEVAGYTALDGRTWYLNPLSADSNGAFQHSGIRSLEFT